MRQMKRRLFTGMFALATVPVAAASVAYACQSLATLHANPNSGAAGTEVVVTGTNYSATGSNIDIRLDSRNATPIKSIPATKTINTTVVIPAGTAVGYHTLIATQNNSSGVPASGTPGRASFNVTAASSSAASNDSAAGPAASEESASGGAAAAPASSEPTRSEESSQPATASQATGTEPAATDASGSAPIDAGAQPAAPAASQRPAAATAVERPATASVAPATAPVEQAPVLASDAVAVDAPAAVDTAPVAPAAPAPVALVPTAAGERPSMLPGLSLAAGLALVLIGLGAFWKSGRATMFGGRNFTPAAG